MTVTKKVNVKAYRGSHLAESEHVMFRPFEPVS